MTNRAIKAWAWIPAIPAEEKDRFEAQARSTAIKNFAIWQKDTAGKPVRHQELHSILPQLLSARKETLPAAKPIVPGPAKQNSLAGFEGRKARILLAEDNIINQEVALSILRKMGLPAVAVDNGQEALKALESTPYDLVLMDCQMPVMDGYEATRAIRNPQSLVCNHQVTVIAMTANAMQGDRDKCLEAGMNDYVSKPVNPRALAEVLGKWLKEDTPPDEG